MEKMTEAEADLKTLESLFLLMDDNPLLKLSLLSGIDRSMQVHDINKERFIFGEYHHLFPELKKDPKRFFEYTRMSIDTFYYILDKVTPYCQKKWCNFHEQPIFAEERLVITIRWLATGCDYNTLAFTFRVGVATVCEIVHEMTEIIWNTLYEKHMPKPTSDSLKMNADDFNDLWDFPHAIGALDGKHIRITNPKHGGRKYYNYKAFYSIVLQGMADARYRFVTIDVGGFGQQSDGGTFRASDLYKQTMDGTFEFPKPDTLPDSNIVAPYFILGDGAYPIGPNLMKPFPGCRLAKNQKVFNMRLSRARRVIECAFGILAQKWRILFRAMKQDPKFVELIVKCLCVLHNVIIDLEGPAAHLQQATTKDFFQEKTREKVDQRPIDRRSGAKVRNDLKNYFASHPIRRRNGIKIRGKPYDK